MTYTNIIYIYIWNISTTTSSTTSAKDGIRPHGPLSRAAASPSQASRVKSYGSSAPVPVVATSRIHSISTYGMTRRTQASQLMQALQNWNFRALRTTESSCCNFTATSSSCRSSSIFLMPSKGSERRSPSSVGTWLTNPKRTSVRSRCSQEKASSEPNILIFAAFRSN